MLQVEHSVFNCLRESANKRGTAALPLAACAVRTAARRSAFVLTLFVPCRAFTLPESNRRLLLARRALCRQRNAPADCFCRNTPGLCTLPRSDIQQHVRSFLSSKCKEKDSQLRLAQRTVLGQQAHPELTLDAWKPGFAPHSSGSPLSLTACTAPSDRGALGTFLLTSEYHREPSSLAGSEDADRRLAKKNVPGRKDVLPFSSSLPELRALLKVLASKKLNQQSVSLLTNFAERELHGQFRPRETARK